jgi:tRNA(Ile)-lysidine synthase
LSSGGPGLSLARPLITVPRATLLAYAEQHGLRWIEDESNTDTAFARNFLRHEVLPVVERRFPAYRETLARAAQHFAEADVLLDELAALDLAHMLHAEKLRLAALAKLSPARAMNALRAYLKQQGVPALDGDRVQEWLRQLLSARGDRQVALGVAGLMLRRYRGEAWVELDRPAPDPSWEVPWQGERKLKLDDLGVCLVLLPVWGTGVSLAKLTQAQVSIRLRQGGEKLKPSCARPRRTLKHLLQEAGIPPWQRERLPLIYSGGQLVAVPGIGVDCAFQASTGEAGLQVQFELKP